MFWLLAQAESLPVLLEEMRKASAAATGTSPADRATSVIYLFILVVIAGGIAWFYTLRFMLNHATQIHEKSQTTLLDLTAKHEARCTQLSEMFTSECTALREMNARNLADARDMVHAARDIASVALNNREFVERYRKAEEELRLRTAERERGEKPAKE